MAELRVEGADLVLHLTRWQRVIGFHGDLRMPLTSVRSVTAVPKPFLALRGRRMAGTAMRGVTATGTWIHGDRQFDFCAVRRDEEAVQVDLATGRFVRWMVGVPMGSSDAEADRIAAAAGIARSQ